LAISLRCQRVPGESTDTSPLLREWVAQVVRVGSGGGERHQARAHRSGQAFAREGDHAHFAGLFLRPDRELHVPASTILPQQALEQLLGTWLAELGVPVLHGHELTGLTQDADRVGVQAATAAGEVIVRGDYLVGCDGGRSTVRKLAGFEFPGTTRDTVKNSSSIGPATSPVALRGMEKH